MDLTEEEKEIQSQATRFVKEYEAELLNRFVLAKKPIKVGVFAAFMAGSPGAGKTEFTRRFFVGKNFANLLKILKKVDKNFTDPESLFIRIDVDEIREAIPGYRKADKEKGIKGNAHVIQKAAGQCLEMIREYCLQNEISFVYDGTFANYDTMRKIVKESVRQGRAVEIYYIYLDPLVAWEFTKAREFLEGRNIVKEKFIEQFFKAEENVEKIKKEFQEKVKVHVIIKNVTNEVEEIGFNVKSLDEFIQNRYKKGSIKLYTHEELQKKIIDVL